MAQSAAPKHESTRRATYQDVLDAPAHLVAEIIDEPELHFDEEIVVPDLAGWRRERMPEYPDTAYFTLAPDWVCEALSASTRKVDLHEKRPIYALAGVPHLWLVDPADRTLEVFELHDGQWLLIGSAKDDEPVSFRPFDAITFSLGDLWP